MPTRRPIPDRCPKNLNQSTPCQIIRKGYFHRRARPRRVRRFFCKRCRSHFSACTGTLEYRNRRRGLNRRIFELILTGASNRFISTGLACSEHLIRGRVSWMGRAALLRHSQMLEGHRISEPLAYDGLENFAQSQYDINHVQHAIGTRSFFIYDFAYAPLNRKGTMTQAQREIVAHRDLKLGRYPGDAILKTTRAIWKRLLDQAQPGKALEIRCDGHPQYRGAMKRSSLFLKILRFKGKKEGVRGYRNPLFAVDHADLLIRQQISAFRRETIAFSKTPIGMIWRYALFMVWKNTMRPIFTKPQPLSKRWMQTTTPAMAIRLARKPLRFEQLFSKRIQTDGMRNLEWKHFIDAQTVPVARNPPQRQLRLLG